jgi:hypothetical protein
MLYYYEPQEGCDARGELRHGRVFSFSINSAHLAKEKQANPIFVGSRLNFGATTDVTVRMSRSSIKVCK